MIPSWAGRSARRFHYLTLLAIRFGSRLARSSSALELLVPFLPIFLITFGAFLLIKREEAPAIEHPVSEDHDELLHAAFRG